MISSIAHGRVERLVRPLGAEIVRTLKESLEGGPMGGAAPRLSRCVFARSEAESYPQAGLVVLQCDRGPV